ncbi:type III-B CRISPR module-associated protein Cmr5 [Candidatus Binatia bacterium]|nr:type III-B CRISPR module-associated protein Cmr5 [Candidatus Binatia bacterium]
MPELKSLDQTRAAYAWQKVGERPDDRYVKLAKGAPALIMSNGLMQTLAFFQSKGGHHENLMRHVLEWLSTRAGQTFDTDFSKAMKYLHSTGSEQYMRATEEALEILRWIRQFAAARAATIAVPKGK